MRKPSLILGAVLGGLTSLPLITLSYLGEQWARLPFVPFDLFDWLARVMPGKVITFVIDTMVRFITALGLGPISNAAKKIEQLQGIALIVIGGIIVGFIIAVIAQKTKWLGRNIGTVAGIILYIFIVTIELNLKTALVEKPVISLFWLAILIIGWATFLGSWITAERLSPETSITEEFRSERRSLLVKLTSWSVGMAVVALGLGKLLESQMRATGEKQSLAKVKSLTPKPSSSTLSQTTSKSVAAATMRERVPAVLGTRPELTPTDKFYRINIDTRPPVIEQTSWKLKVSGLFDRPRPLSFSDIMVYPAVTQPITLSCISNPIGGDLISTSNWMGVPLRVVLQDLGLRPEVKELAIKSADGFYESVTMMDMMDPRTLLVYGMNDETLPVEHGFPLRIYIPNRYGMKQPKWITEIEAINHKGSGYWVDRGWSEEAHPQIISVIDTVVKNNVENGRIPIGGIAWAGDRGIQKVEVQIDGRDWNETMLRTPPLSPLTWIQWRYDWPTISGKHTFRVRAIDGTGAMQIEQEHDTYPDGATGYHSVTTKI